MFNPETKCDFIISSHSHNIYFRNSFRSIFIPLHFKIAKSFHRFHVVWGAFFDSNKMGTPNCDVSPTSDRRRNATISKLFGFGTSKRTGKNKKSHEKFLGTRRTGVTVRRAQAGPVQLPPPTRTNCIDLMGVRLLVCQVLQRRGTVEDCGIAVAGWGGKTLDVSKQPKEDSDKRVIHSYTVAYMSRDQNPGWLGYIGNHTIPVYII